MAWTTPRTWVTSEVVTAAIMNAHVRDNFNETSAKTAAAAGDLVYADAANSMGSRVAIGSTRSVLMSTGSAPVWRDTAWDDSAASDTISFASLGSGYVPMESMDSGTLPSISVTLTTNTYALIAFGCRISNTSAGAAQWVSFGVSGATSISPSDNYAIMYEASNANDQAEMGTTYVETSLTAGSNTIKLWGRTTAGVATFDNPRLFVWAL